MSREFASGRRGARRAPAAVDDLQRFPSRVPALERLAIAELARRSGIGRFRLGGPADPEERVAEAAAERFALAGDRSASSGDARRRTSAPPPAPSPLVGGRPLPASPRRELERAFRADFSAVTVHTSPAVGELGRKMGARAFAVGRQIGFAPGEFRPDTAGGRRLLAHELAHTLQPAGAVPTIRRALLPESPFAKSTDRIAGSRRESPHEPDALAVLESSLRTGGGGNGAADFEAILGVTDFYLNRKAAWGSAEAVNLGLELPTLRETRGAAALPNLADPILDPVRANTLELARGSSGPEVELVQRALIAWGATRVPAFDPLPIGADSGNYDAETESAVRDFQADPANGALAVDGIVGDHTLAAMQALPAPAGQSTFSIDRVPLNRLTGFVRIPGAPSSWAPRQFAAGQLRQWLMAHGFPVRAGLQLCDRTRALEVRVTDGPQLVQDVLDHERIHEADVLRIFAAWLDPWHEGLLAMLHDGHAVAAANAAAAAPLLWAELGRRTGAVATPCGVGRAIHVATVDAANALHRLAGGNSRVQDFHTNSPLCSRVRVDWGTFPGRAAGGNAQPRRGCATIKVPRVTTVV